MIREGFLDSGRQRSQRFVLFCSPSSPPGAMSETNEFHWNSLESHFAHFATGVVTSLILGGYPGADSQAQLLFCGPSSTPGAMSGTNEFHWNPLESHFAPTLIGLLIFGDSGSVCGSEPLRAYTFL